MKLKQFYVSSVSPGYAEISNEKGDERVYLADEVDKDLSILMKAWDEGAGIIRGLKLRNEALTTTIHVLQEKLRGEGFVSAPVEPTQHQLHAAYDGCMMHLPYKQSSCFLMASNIYLAMISVIAEEEE